MMRENRARARHFRNLLPIVDRALYLGWRVLKGKAPLELGLREGTRIVIRPKPATDYGVAYEIFLLEVYERATRFKSQEIKRIVDLGANVGYTLLYWARRYPEARILAFEPHPVHCGQIRRHIELNDLRGRVTLIEAAACSSETRLWLSDSNSCSSIVEGSPKGRLSVPGVDFFTKVGQETIDLLKIDVEGAEYEIFSDPRFGELRIANLIMEWHVTETHWEGGRWCANRLSGLGYQVELLGDQQGDVGLLWASRGV
ncbi:MAG: FkbM family methyltransferase [Acidobacteria bacterium]|nr:FkbM family methyltransferase [Acidobacteriota bacterium]